MKVPGSAAHTSKISQCDSSHMAQVLFKLLPLGLGAREFLHVPFLNFSFYRPLVVSPTGFQIQVLQGLSVYLSGAGPPWAEELDGV